MGLSMIPAVFLLIVITFFTLPTANAATITVPTDFLTIQAAIDAATPDDSIKVLRGTYEEQIIITKNIILSGSEAKSTIIKAPDNLKTSQFLQGTSNVIELSNNAKVTMKGFTIQGKVNSSCGNLFGIAVVNGATINLDTSSINGCTARAVLVGFCGMCFPGGPQIGHATITRSNIQGYREIGITSGGEGSTILVSGNKIVATDSPETPGQTGIVFGLGVKGTVHHNEISNNICKHPACGPDFFNQIQAIGILSLQSDPDSAIFNNKIKNNDVGIGVFSPDGCCKINHNKLQDNRFFGIVFLDGQYTSSQDKISGGDVGVAAIALSVDTVATLDHDKITETTTPTQELECCGFNAEIVTIPALSNSFQTSQFQSFQVSDMDSDLLMKKFGILGTSTHSNSESNPF
jgi:nitrous oxidase accessory protein NosD